jgi:miniconductance mechanosensitive channel
MQNNFFRNLALIVPGIILNASISSVFNGDAYWADIAGNIVSVYLIFAAVLCVDALLNSLLEIYRTLPLSQEIPLTGFFQILKIVLYGCGVLFIIATILNRSPLYIFSGLGAMTAVLMLIFKDPILGFVAGIQLISNKMLKQGDWIEMPKYGADGDVMDITLSTVKVRNFDKTITTIPTYSLIADSFKNWRGMKESGGRRIKRAVHIDINSIRFCNQDMLDRFTQNNYISDYIKKKNQEISEHNAKLTTSGAVPLTSRRLTNIGTFRAYILAYLRNHPMINQKMTFLVRQLAPTENGLPLEIYVFCKDNTWAVYEEVQADIFDHLLAVAPEFDLRVYQLPSGRDIQTLENIFDERRVRHV